MTERASSWPISPASILAFSAANVGSKRRWNPIRQAFPDALTISSHSRARLRSRSTGFSQKMCFPALAERWIRSACVSVEEPMSTASIAGSAKTLSTVTTGAARSDASFCAASGIASAIPASVTPGLRAAFDAWICPMRPAPMTAILIAIDSSLLGLLMGRSRRRQPGPGYCDLCPVF